MLINNKNLIKTIKRVDLTTEQETNLNEISNIKNDLNNIKNTELENLNTAIQTLETLVGVDETVGDKTGLPSGDANIIASINRIDSKPSGAGLTPEQEAKLNSIDNKVDKINGKGLSTNDYTTEEKTTLSNLKTAVGDTNSGLIKDVKDLKTNGVSQDNINSAIENYLTEHPVASGATVEQAAQIEANRVAIGDTNSGLIKEVNNIKNTELQNLNTAIQRVNETVGDKSGLPSGDANVIASINRIDRKTTTEPQWNDIPKLSFNGDVTSMSKETYCTLDFTYRSNTMCYYGKAKLKWQGSSSLSYPKKNYTIRLLEKDGTTKKYINFKGWGRQEKFVLKANYVDSLHLRNLAGARIAYDMITSRSDFDQLPHEMQTSPRCNTIDGFPVKVYMNGELYGIYTMNIPKDKWAYNLEEGNVNHAFLMAEKNNNGDNSTSDKLVLACEFRGNATIFADTSSEQYPPYDWVVEAPGDDVGENIRVSFNNLINCVKDTTDTEFKSTIGNYLDLTAAFDYYCFSYLCCHYDGLGKNLGMITYDGIKWYPTLYDMDSIFGAKIDGSGFLETNRKCPEQYQESHSLLWERIEKCFAKELYARYKELRAGALSIGNIMSRCEQIYDIISDRMYSEDAKKWSNIPSQKTNTIDRIRSYMKSRAEYVDNEFELFNIEPVPVTSISLNETNITLNEEGIVTLSVTFEPSNTNQRDIIWESSDNSIATVENGIVRGISKGNCTITATSTYNSSIKSTCTVIVNEAPEGSPIVWVNSDDLTSSSSVWNDKTNNNYNFNITDGTPNITDGGLYMGSCKVQGENENISLNGVFTYNVKFKIEETTNDYACFVSFNQNNTSKYCDNITDSGLKVNGYSGDTITTLNISNSDFTTIHNLTIVYNTTNIRVYYNGEFHSEYPKGTANLNGNFKLVLGSSSFGNFPINISKFRIKEFKLYNTVLSDDQIRTL